MNGKHIKWINLLHRSGDMKSLKNQYFVFLNSLQNVMLEKFIYYFLFVKFNSRKMKTIAYFSFGKSQKLVIEKINTRENLFL